MMKVRTTITEAAAMMERRQSSGLSVQAFCEAEHINHANYYYWRQRLNEIRETSKIIPVRIEKAEHHPVFYKEIIELTYPNGVRLSIPSGCELNLIRELIMIL